MSSGQRVRLGIPLIAALLFTTPLVAQAAPPTPCYDVDIQFLGRTVHHVASGVTFYTWNYRVTGQTCINRAMSHWVLEVCPAYQNQITNISTLSVDHSDPAGGDSTTFSTALGNDPTTGVNGLKWNYATGNQLDKVNEYDDFSFVAPGSPTLMNVAWGSKGATIVEHGTVVGPACGPLPVQALSWGALKARY